MGILYSCAKCSKRFLGSPTNELGFCKSCYEAFLKEKEERAQQEREREVARILENYVLLENTYKGTDFNILTKHDELKRNRVSLEKCKDLYKQIFESEPEDLRNEAIKKDPKSLIESNSSYVKHPDFGLIFYKVGSSKLDYSWVLRHIEDDLEKCKRYETNAFIREYNTEKYEKTMESLPEYHIEIDKYASFAERQVKTLEKTNNITSRTTRDSLCDYIAVDLETTGLSAERNEIVEIAAIKFLDFQPSEVFHSFVKPKNGLKEKAKEINGIDEEQTDDAPYIEQITASFNAFIGASLPIVGHNIPFDYKFLATVDPEPFNSKRKYYDTLSLSRRTFELDSYKLDDLCWDVLHIDRDDSHQAVSDALVAGLLFKEICDERVEN